jgi:hypothetical protein
MREAVEERANTLKSDVEKLPVVKIPRSKKKKVEQIPLFGSKG